MRIFFLLILSILSTPCFADSALEKVDESTVKITETVSIERKDTIKNLKEKLERINTNISILQIKKIEVEALITEAINLGVKE